MKLEVQRIDNGEGCGFTLEVLGAGESFTDAVSAVPHVTVMTHHDHVHLSGLYVPVEMRATGIARHLMVWTLLYLDSLKLRHLPVMLDARPYGESPPSREVLIKFYEGLALSAGLITRRAWSSGRRRWIMADTKDDCMTILANVKRRMQLVVDYAKALRIAADHDEAVLIHSAMMLEIGFVQSDQHKLEAWLRVAKACGLEGPQMLPVPAIRDEVAMAAVDQLRSQRHPELPLRVERVDVRRLAANDHDDEEGGDV